MVVDKEHQDGMALEELKHKMVGPYKVKKLVGSLCQLDLPISMKIHDVFHSSFLQKAAKNPLPDQHNNFALPVIVKIEKK